MGNVKRLLAGIFVAAAMAMALAPAASAASMVEYALLASPDATAIEYGV
ncbi:hypothetical protein H4696_005890 [Amycolatopsis lexingtonensis]|uniref:Uncharacterized protein n=1 Tax=Amycolatopsis lexingtonensis TaxID=218822 RepID=A0ABR9I6J6_9PSEU|nr:hypothetical protein [Amycolatopsis lexingtonensis]MBE1498790.1 hypothetical protein [Amycolatopsis lexingtonensis]